MINLIVRRPKNSTEGFSGWGDLSVLLPSDFSKSVIYYWTLLPVAPATFHIVSFLVK